MSLKLLYLPPKPFSRPHRCPYYYPISATSSSHLDEFFSSQPHPALALWTPSRLRTLTHPISTRSSRFSQQHIHGESPSFLKKIDEHTIHPPRHRFKRATAHWVLGDVFVLDQSGTIPWEAIVMFILHCLRIFVDYQTIGHTGVSFCIVVEFVSTQILGRIETGTSDWKAGIGKRKGSIAGLDR